MTAHGDGMPVPAAGLRLRVVELGQPLSGSMALWRGRTGVEISIEEIALDHDVADGRLSGTTLTMPAHAGTHVDAARHFYPDGTTIDEYPIDRFVCRAAAIDVRRRGPEPLTADELRAADPGLEPGDGALLCFGYGELYSESAYYDHPYLDDDAAEYLAERKVNVVGVDILTPDVPSERRPQRFHFPVHTSLLSADVLIVENLGPNLATLVDSWFTFVFPPLRLEGADASPIAPLALLGDP
jgi:kynurenine formamidase